MSDNLHIATVPTPPSAKTGYGTQLKHIIQGLGDDYQWTSVVESRQQMRGDDGVTTQWGPPVRILQTTGDPKGKDVMPDYDRLFDFDLIIGFTDAFGIDYLQHLDTPTVALFPIDSPTFSESETWQGMVGGNDRCVAYSEFGYRQLVKSDIPTSKCRYIPHGIDTDTFYPRGAVEQRGALDKFAGMDDVVDLDTFGGLDEPDDGTLIFLCVAQNYGSERKNITLLIDAFKEYSEWVQSESEPDVDTHLLIHTDRHVNHPAGFDYGEFVRRRGVGDIVHFPKRSPRLFSWTDDEMAALYSAADLYVSAAEAEGFGLPLLESCACATPILAPDNSAQSELLEGSGGFSVCTDQVSYANYTPFLQAQYPPTVDSLAYEMVAAARLGRADLGVWGDHAKDFARRNYDIESIVEDRWRSLIEEFE